MEAKELRIGNHVWGVSERKEIVIEISENHVITDHFLPHLLSAPHKGKLKHIEPIKLTEQWLKWFGFDKGSDIIGECYYLEQGSNPDFCVYIPENEEGFYFYEPTIDLYDVHQLQNLYFALTGEELILNDKQNNYED